MPFDIIKRRQMAQSKTNLRYRAARSTVLVTREVFLLPIETILSKRLTLATKAPLTPFDPIHY